MENNDRIGSKFAIVIVLQVLQARQHVAHLIHLIVGQ